MVPAKRPEESTMPEARIDSGPDWDPEIDSIKARLSALEKIVAPQSKPYLRPCNLCSIPTDLREGQTYTWMADGQWVGDLSHSSRQFACWKCISRHWNAIQSHPYAESLFSSIAERIAKDLDGSRHAGGHVSLDAMDGWARDLCEHIVGLESLVQARLALMKPPIISNADYARHLAGKPSDATT